MSRGQTPPGASKTSLTRVLWTAVAAAILALAVASVGAQASGGGVSRESGGLAPTAWTFGSRTLRVGMQGDDVKILNGIVRSKAYGSSVALTDLFENPTASAVKQFQLRKALAPTGVVDSGTATALTQSMRRAGATWYGPGFYGNQTACGKTLRTTTIGVANRTLPCGTRVTFSYHGRYLVAPVIDRGPYRKGYDWDLTSAAAQKLGLTSSDLVRYAVPG
jgi:peptidoglycan hydrolase-like protein with peptidoglycan-binding domain